MATQATSTKRNQPTYYRFFKRKFDKNIAPRIGFPLRRNVTTEEVGNAAAFLCSDLASGTTGEIVYVDSGFNTVGMTLPKDEKPAQ